MKVLIFLVLASAVIGDDFEVEELEVRNMHHHKKVLKIDRDNLVPDTDTLDSVKDLSAANDILDTVKDLGPVKDLLEDTEKQAQDSGYGYDRDSGNDNEKDSGNDVVIESEDEYDDLPLPTKPPPSNEPSGGSKPYPRTPEPEKPTKQAQGSGALVSTPYAPALLVSVIMMMLVL